MNCKFALILIVNLVVGCGVLPKNNTTAPSFTGEFYKRDLEVCFNGKCGDGVLVVPKQSAYDFKVKSKGSLELFTFSTCHREETTEGGGGWFGSSKSFEGKYIPQKLETDYCPAYLGGYNKDGINSWGFIDFEDDEAKLPAVLSCNGQKIVSNGVSICQSKAGLMQEIVFANPVTVEFDSAKCKIPKSEDGKSFKFEMIKGECVIAFFGDNKIHRLTLLGYDKIMIRGN